LLKQQEYMRVFISLVLAGSALVLIGCSDADGGSGIRRREAPTGSAATSASQPSDGATGGSNSNPTPAPPSSDPTPAPATPDGGDATTSTFAADVTTANAAQLFLDNCDCQ
jgi:hypothetical protein